MIYLIFQVITDLYKSAFIPTFDPKYAGEKLQEKVEAEIRYATQTASIILESDESKENYLSGLKRLFPFAKCKCFLKASKIEEVTAENCHCKPENKTPNLDFFADQLFHRTQVILISEEDKIAFQCFIEKNRPKSKTGGTYSNQLISYATYYMC